MHTSYQDITDQLGEPRWWDEHAVPRYCGFSPSAIANVYAAECCLAVVECQACGREFRVAFSRSRNDVILYGSLADLVRSRNLHFGDPPNAGCCHAGATMNSIPVRVLEFWRGRDDDGRLCEPDRVHELEVGIVPDWVGGGRERLEARVSQIARFREALVSNHAIAPALWVGTTPFPWARSLSFEEARAMCGEMEKYAAYADAVDDIDTLEGCLAGWRSTAEVYEDPEGLAALLSPAD